MTEFDYVVASGHRDKRFNRLKCRIYNFFLVLKYPFLRVDGKYEYTYLDDMPVGWRVAFGAEMCSRIRNQLLKEKGLKDYKVFQVKEKFGELRWYDNGSRAVQDIVDQYSSMSIVTCVKCGEEATWLTTGWIVPLCDECKRKEEESSPHPRAYHPL